jgi:hypothetical protein
MLSRAAVPQSGPSGMHKAWVSACVFLASAPLPRTPARRHVAAHRRNKFPLTTCLTSVAACLGAMFAASIALEAFDADVALWHGGAEHFAAGPQAQLLRGDQPGTAGVALNLVLWFVMTAGAYLVLRYRARSVLSTDSLSISVVFHRAEPWGRHSD